MSQSIIDINPVNQTIETTISVSQSNITTQLEDLHTNYMAFHHKLVSFREHIYNLSFFELNQLLHDYCASAEYIISKLEQRLRAMGLSPHQKTSSTIAPYNLYAIVPKKLSSNDMLQLIKQSQRYLNNEIRNIENNAEMVNDRDTVKLTSSILGNIGQNAWSF